MIQMNGESWEQSRKFLIRIMAIFTSFLLFIGLMTVKQNYPTIFLVIEDTVI